MVVFITDCAGYQIFLYRVRKNSVRARADSILYVIRHPVRILSRVCLTPPETLKSCGVLIMTQNRLVPHISGLSSV